MMALSAAFLYSVLVSGGGCTRPSARVRNDAPCCPFRSHSFSFVRMVPWLFRHSPLGPAIVTETVLQSVLF